MKRTLLAGLVAASLLLAACDLPNANNQIYTSVEWEVDTEGSIQYKTNDPNNLGYIFSSRYSSLRQDTMSNPLTIKLKKLSGDIWGGSGVFFCFDDSWQNGYRVLVDTQQYYIITKTLNGASSLIQDWQTSNDLQTGLGTVNTIKIELADVITGKFNIYFNNAIVPSASFTDTSFKGGNAGFSVAVGEAGEESFPSTPVDVRFKAVSPAAIP